MQILSAAYGSIDTLSLHPFHIQLSIFFAKAINVHKQRVLAYATDPLKAVMTLRSSSPQHPPMENPRKVGKYAHRDVGYARRNTNTANGEEMNVANDAVGAVH